MEIALVLVSIVAGAAIVALIVRRFGVDAATVDITPAEVAPEPIRLASALSAITAQSALPQTMVVRLASLLYPPVLEIKARA